MNSQPQHPSVVAQMVWKDLQLHRRHIVATIICGIAALGLLIPKRPVTTVVGSVTFFIALILVGCLLAASNILNERKRQTLPFLMSLPISAMEYTTAKLVGTVLMFAIPWSTLVIAAIWLIAVRGVLFHGVIPIALITLLLPLVGLCVMMAITLVGETEGWSNAANVIVNSSYSLVWCFIAFTPSLTRHVQSKVIVWNSTEVTFLASEPARSF
jgi:ABC-2 type transport system permease protein